MKNWAINIVNGTIISSNKYPHLGNDYFHKFTKIFVCLFPL